MESSNLYHTKKSCSISIIIRNHYHQQKRLGWWDKSNLKFTILMYITWIIFHAMRFLLTVRIAGLMWAKKSVGVKRKSCKMEIKNSRVKRRSKKFPLDNSFSVFFSSERRVFASSLQIHPFYHPQCSLFLSNANAVYVCSLYACMQH